MPELPDSPEPPVEDPGPGEGGVATGTAPADGRARRFSREEGLALLRVAGDSIEHGLTVHQPLPVNVEAWPPAFRVPTATFVTLHLGKNLRGCIGTLEAVRPLVADVAHNAFAAAFHDPRFPPVRIDELVQLVIHISLLSAPEAMRFSSEEDLLRQIRPGVDGLILSEGGGWYGPRRGTFLPAVWETLREPREFLRHLKMKAGLPADYWSGTVRVERYTAESVP